MRTGITLEVSASDKVRLEAIVAARGSPPKARLAGPDCSADRAGLGITATMAATGKSKTCVWRWQERFLAEGVDGLLRDKTCLPGATMTHDYIGDDVLPEQRALFAAFSDQTISIVAGKAGSDVTGRIAAIIPPLTSLVEASRNLGDR